MLARRNSTHGGFIRGEWWITNDGEVLFADQDIGEEGHEAIALRYLIDSEVLADELLKRGLIAEDDVDMIMEYGAGVVLAGMKIPGSVGVKAAGEQVWKDIIDMGPREAFMKHHNAIMVVGESFYVWKVTEKSINAIQNFIFEEADGEDLNPKTSVYVEQVTPHKYSDMPWGEFQFIKKPSEMVWSRV